MKNKLLKILSSICLLLSCIYISEAQVNDNSFTASSGNKIPTGIVNFRNRIRNGDFIVNQRAQTKYTNQASVTLDGWQIGATGGGELYTVQVTNAFVGNHQYAVQITNVNDGALALTDYYFIRQGIEGYNVADMQFGTTNASQFTLQFWAKTTLTGTYCVAFGNGSIDQTQVIEYQLNTSNTWTYFTMTASGSTTGVWYNQNLGGLYVYWDLFSGTNWSTSTTNAWTGGNFRRTPNQAHYSTTIGQTFSLAGIQLEKGSVATDFEFRPYSVELELCQRYCEVHGGLYGGSWPYCYIYIDTATATFGIPCSYATEKRAIPTVTKKGDWNNSGCGEPLVATYTVNGYFLTTTNSVVGASVFYPDSVDDVIWIESEL